MSFLTRHRFLRRGGYLSASGNLLGWMALRAGAQAVLMVLLARAIGASQYGQYVAVLAVATFLTPFAGLGLASVLLRNGARDGANLQVYLWRALRLWGISATASVLLAWLTAQVLLPPGIPWLAAGLALGAEVVAASLTEIAARHRQAQHRIGSFGAINAGLILARLLAMSLALLAAEHFDVEWALLVHAASSAAYASFLWWRLPPRVPDRPVPEPMAARTGVPFSLATFAVRLQAEFNKPALAHLGFGMAGNFNAAQRANELVGMPLSALQEALWPRLYAHQDPARQLRRIGAFLLVAAGACSALLWLAAPLLPHILGSDFTGAITVMRSLAWLPILQVFRSLANFHVIHAGNLRLLGWAYAGGATVSVACVAGLVPRYGMPGAVAAIYVTEAATIAILSVGALRSRRT